jgi:hypothetical protein
VFIECGGGNAGYNPDLGYDDAMTRYNRSLSSASGIDLLNAHSSFILLDAVLCHYFVEKLSYLNGLYTAKLARHSKACRMRAVSCRSGVLQARLVSRSHRALYSHEIDVKVGKVSMRKIRGMTVVVSAGRETFGTVFWRVETVESENALPRPIDENRQE